MKKFRGILPVIAGALVFLLSGGAFAESLYFYDTSGGKVSLDNFKGKPTVVFVYKKNCAICLNMLMELDRVKPALENEVNIVPVMVEDASTIAARRLFTRLDIRTLPIYLDKDDVLSPNWGFRVTPVTVLISADGTVIKKVAGKMDWTGPFFADEIRELKGFSGSYEGILQKKEGEIKR